MYAKYKNDKDWGAKNWHTLYFNNVIFNFINLFNYLSVNWV